MPRISPHYFGKIEFFFAIVYDFLHLLLSETFDYYSVDVNPGKNGTLVYLTVSIESVKKMFFKFVFIITIIISITLYTIQAHCFCFITTHGHTALALLKPQ